MSRASRVGDAICSAGTTADPLSSTGWTSASTCRALSAGFPRRGPFSVTPVEQLDTTRFEIHCYSAGSINGGPQGQLRQLAAHWLDVAAIDDEQLALRVRADEIDVLIDLDGHVPGNRLRALSYKPAPVIVSWLDYFNTTGLDTVDFVLGDEISIPTTGTQVFSERLLRLEPSRLCYAPPTYAPATAMLPMLRNGYVTFGSFNRLSKIAEPVVTLWARLLREIPNSRLILKSAAFAHPNTRTVFLQRFHVRGIAVERIELRGASPHEQMLAEYLATSTSRWTRFPITGDSPPARPFGWAYQWSRFSAVP